MYQSITIVGRLGQDPEVRMTPSGQACANVSVAVSKSWTNRDGKKEERTEWFRVTAWGKLAEIVGKYLKKGALVMFVGEMQTRSWDGTDGQKHYRTELIANEMKMLGGKSEGGSGGGQASNYGAQSYATSGYDAPPNYGSYDAPPPRGGSEDDVPF